MPPADHINQHSSCQSNDLNRLYSPVAPVIRTTFLSPFLLETALTVLARLFVDANESLLNPKLKFDVLAVESRLDISFRAEFRTEEMEGRCLR